MHFNRATWKAKYLMIRNSDVCCKTVAILMPFMAIFATTREKGQDAIVKLNKIVPYKTFSEVNGSDPEIYE